MTKKQREKNHLIYGIIAMVFFFTALYFGSIGKEWLSLLFIGLALIPGYFVDKYGIQDTGVNGGVYIDF